MNDDPLPRLRELCLALPEATEKLSHGEPTWFVRKVFVTYAGHHHDDRLAFWCAAPPGAQEALVAARPAGGSSGRRTSAAAAGSAWTSTPVTGDLDWDEIGEIVTDAYREIAPKRLVALLD